MTFFQYQRCEAHAGGKNPVEQGGLPLDEGFILEHQGHAAKQHYQRQTDPQHAVHLAVAEAYPGDLRDRCQDDDHGGQ